MKPALRKADESTLQYNVRWPGGSGCKLETVAIPGPARPDQLADSSTPQFILDAH